MRAPRGQNLVLLALTMLFLALMVTMTIGLGLRIRQKQELQALADTAAYSNAVMTARTFNNMALINRLEVSYWVAQAADQSLISWGAYGIAMGNATLLAADRLQSSPCLRLNLRARREVSLYRGAVARYLAQELKGPRDSSWEELDRAAGKESLAIQQMVVTLRSELSPVGEGGPGGETLKDRFYQYLQSQQLTRQIVATSQQDDVSIIEDVYNPGRPSAAAVSMREVDCDFGDSANGPMTGEPPKNSGLCLRSTWSQNMLHAAMGSRGHWFLTGRTLIPGTVRRRLDDLAAERDGVSVWQHEKNGSAYWSTHDSHGNSPFIAKEAWGDDHGKVTVSAGGCSSTEDASSYIKSTDLVERSDRHDWEPHRMLVDQLAKTRDDEDHTMGDCTPLCPSVWVRTIGFQPSDDESDAWGQPKVVVALQRDLTQHSFPWELHFTFPFSATGTAGKWDGRGQKLQSGAATGLNISSQTALATGIAYYHRREHWEEFPNLLNPFWRATLAPLDVDAPVKGNTRDVTRSLGGAQHGWQRAAYDVLVGAGFEGLH